MDVCTGTVSIDICTTTTPHSRWLHHMSNIPICVAHTTVSVRPLLSPPPCWKDKEVTNTPKHCLGSLIQKSLRRDKQCMKNELTTLPRLRKMKCCEKRERTDTNLELSFSFSVVVLTCACSQVLSS